MDKMLTNKYKHAEHGNIVPWAVILVFIGMVMLITGAVYVSMHFIDVAADVITPNGEYEPPDFIPGPGGAAIAGIAGVALIAGLYFLTRKKGSSA